MLAVPPGQHPTRITPTARSVGRPSSTDSAHAARGMMLYWEIQPMMISLGRVNTTLKSSALMVRPMPNMAAPKNQEVYLVAQAKTEGTAMAAAENRMMTTPI